LVNLERTLSTLLSSGHHYGAGGVSASGAPAQIYIIVTTIRGGTRTALDHDDESGNIFQSRVAGPFPIEPEAVRRNVAVNVLEFSTSTECENDLQTPTTTLLCAGGTFFACFDYLLSILWVDGNVLMGPRLVVRIQWDMLI
jgi:hypothetical protein